MTDLSLWFFRNVQKNQQKMSEGSDYFNCNVYWM